MISLSVPLADRSYPVLVGSGAVRTLASVMPTRAKRAAIVTQAGIGVDVDPGIEHRVFTIGDGEEVKTLSTISDLCRAFASWGMTRADAVVGVGGGLVTDVAGFAAASYHRGIPVVHVATSLLAMVDAAIGGKTGVNLPEGKNLVGAFWQPSAVLCDLDALATLPARELACGRGEMAKYHFLTGDDLLALPLDQRIARCIKIKADVVGADEREAVGSTGGRALLNYGHTLAHALEIVTDHELRHGEAVAIGLLFAARVAHAMDRVSAERVAEHDAVVASYDLRSSLPDGLSADRALALMMRDKKAIDSLTFILDGPNGLEQVPGIDADLVRRVLVDFGATA